MRKSRRRHVLHPSVALCLTLASGASFAQTPAARPTLVAEGAFEQLWANVVVDLKEAFDRSKDRLDSTALFRSSGPRRPTALEPENAADLASWATAAIRTESKDVAAGLTVSPFSGSNSAAKGLGLSAASLEGDQTRFGVSFSSANAPDILFSDLGLEPCSADAAIKPPVRAGLKGSFTRVCVALKAPLERFVAAAGSDKGDLGGAQDNARRMLWSCGFISESSALPIGERQLLPPTFVEAAASLANKNDRDTLIAADAELECTFSASALDLERLGDFTRPLPTDCISDKQLEGALQRAQWVRTKTSTTLKFVTDRFAHKGGFNPDETKPLPKGQVKSWQARVDWALESRGRSVTIGLGYGRSRTEAGQELGRTLSPSFSVAFPGWSLSPGTPLTGLGKGCCGSIQVLNLLENGDLPPHVVFGLNAKADLNLDRPDTQTTRFNKIELTAFADFKINKTLSFRLGIPFRGEVVMRDANGDKGIAEQRSLQWSIPVSIVTVIKM